MVLEAIGFVACLLVVAWLSTAETACFSLSRIEVRRLASTNVRGAVLGRLLADPPELLSTILILSTAASVGASTAGAALLNRALGLANSPLVIADVILTSMALLVLGDITPKTFAVHHAEPLALAMAPALGGLETALRPFSRALGGLARRAGGFAARTHGHPERADLIASIEAGRDEGILAHAERELLLGALHYRQRTVEAIMQPWVRVLTIPVGMTAGAALDRLAARRVSRAPLVSPSGAVLGVVRAQDLLPLVVNGHGDRLAREALRPAFFVRPETSLDVALRTVRSDRTYVLIVATDARQPLGFVAMRDLMEELWAASRSSPAPSPSPAVEAQRTAT